MKHIDKLKLILHPVRMQIVQTLQGGRTLTPLQMAKHLVDIPQATLYRHINKLFEAGIIYVVEERKVRGSIEKVYGLDEKEIMSQHQELIQMNREEHAYFFMTFLTSLQKDFQQYLEQETIDFERDGLGFSQIALNLSDEEFQDFAQSLQKLLENAMKNPSAPGRRRRIVSTIMIPEPVHIVEEPSEDGEVGDS
ncbi:helix-turn-helix domain-containing protein [Risungbinella massiliensis]|uniref:helix-turn-helix domain-containing protein n=1 Tax=Risungbinella massiliensis TaxID=1329796 RepID=UPI00069B4FB0|nr:helix-turn-helix domain-containing protein [Risungbinella massiliensis]